MRHALGKLAGRAVDYALEYVTGLVMNDDGTVDGDGADDRPITTEVGARFGFYSRTKDGAVGVVLRGLGLQFLVAYADKQFAMSLQKGEVGLQNAFSASVLLDKNGQIIMNGGSKKVARVDDHGDAGSLILSFSPGSGAASLSVTYHDPDGNTQVLAAGSGTITLKNKNTEGADKVLA